MLRFNKITIKNFGPYYGCQEIKLRHEDGVSFIWGKNGFGKTSLLNAVRFALWGSLANSKYASRPIAKFINKKAALQNEDMMVRLDCDYNGEKCVIIRLFQRKSIGDGTKTEDYDYSLTVSLGAQTLNQEDANKFLSTAFPSNISRFYLFDAELLDQYEKLVEETNDNTDLKLEIENILGLPVLEHSRECLCGEAGILSQLDREYERVTKEDKKNAKKLKAFEAAKQLKIQIEKEIDEFKITLTSLYEQRQSAEDTLKENKQFSLLVEQEKSILANMQQQSEVVQEERSRLTKAMDMLWSIFYDRTCDSLIKEKNSEIDTLHKETEVSQEQSILLELVEILNNRNAIECPICSGEISGNRLSELLNKLKISSTHTSKRQRLMALQNEVSTLYESKSNNSLYEIITSLDSYIRAFEKFNGLNFDLENIRTKKRSYHTDVTEAEISEIAKTYSTVDHQIQECQKSLDESQSKLQEAKELIERLRNEISKDGDEAVKRVESQIQFIQTLQAIFNDGISWFRDDLKGRVEESASEIFCNISHNKEYVALKINNNYGLEIINANGEIIPNRSEGYEQVVAISLIAALHKNAPIAGPIIMDSTFQRIDPDHKRATLQELPNMGQQIIVLVYPQEVDKIEATNLLGSHYLQDFELVQIDSFETQIQKLGHD